MADQNDILQAFPREDIGDIGNVRVERDLVAHQVRALAKAGERWRVDFVTLGIQQVGHAAPAPSAMPGAMDQHKRVFYIRHNVLL